MTTCASAVKGRYLWLLVAEDRRRKCRWRCVEEEVVVVGTIAIGGHDQGEDPLSHHWLRWYFQLCTGEY